MKNIAEM